MTVVNQLMAEAADFVQMCRTCAVSRDVAEGENPFNVLDHIAMEDLEKKLRQFLPPRGSNPTVKPVHQLEWLRQELQICLRRVEVDIEFGEGATHEKTKLRLENLGKSLEQFSERK